MQYRLTVTKHSGSTYAEILDVDKPYTIMRKIAEYMSLIEGGFYKGLEITREGV